MTHHNFQDVLRSKGFEPFFDPAATKRVLDESAVKIVEKLRARGHEVATKILSDGEHLIYIQGIHHGEADGAFVLSAPNLETISWRRIR